MQKRQPHAVDAVNVGAKRSTHTVYSANMGGGDRYLYCKKVNPHSGCSEHSEHWSRSGWDALNAVDAVGVGAKSTITFSAKRLAHAVDTVNAVDAVDAVGVGVKRSIHTVYSANIGGGDHYL